MAARREVELYLEHAREMLEVAAHNLHLGFHSSAVNRAYYGIFYAANALLARQGLARNKHSGVIAAFRQYFVKPRLIEPEYGDIYQEVMGDRHSGDYDLEVSTTPETAQRDLDYARRFVVRVEVFLQKEGWL